MNADHLRKYVIIPTLKGIDCYSEDAVELLVLTAAQESHCGKYLHQINGPAVGIYQMEPRTHDDIWENYLAYKDDFSFKVLNFGTPSNHFDNNGESYPEPEIMAGNLYYATAMARAHYLRVSESLPDCRDVEALAKYYKQYWNTPLGAATVEQAISNYKRFA